MLESDLGGGDFHSKDFLGQGWKFPISTNENLVINSSRFEESIKESILIILGTRKGERLMRPNFGCGIHDYVFEVVNPMTLGRIEISIKEALTQYEPRINVLDIKISSEKIDTGILLITIIYQVVATNNRFNLVYPFYLREG